MTNLSSEDSQYISIIRQLFPNFSSATIEPKRGTNGKPFFIENGGQKFWIKLVESSQMEDSLNNVEIQALQDIKSDYVIELLEVKTKIINGKRYDAMLFPFIDGDDLHAIVKNHEGTFSEQEVRKILLDVAYGIQAISAKGWVHQDIKQKNIRFNRQKNKYVLLDLGIAYLSKEFSLSTGKHNKDYASAEQVYSSIDPDKIPLITFNSDTSQLGQLAYELLTGKNPFKDSRQRKLDYQKIIKGEYTEISQLHNDLSPELVAIIHTLLNPHPADRYRSMDEFLCALENKTFAIPAPVIESGVYFQIWKGPQGYTENVNQCDHELSGAVVSASQMPADTMLTKIKEKELKLIFDPETHLLTGSTDVSWHGSLSGFTDWYLPSYSPSYFNHKSRLSSFVAKIVQTQIDQKTDYIMPPYFNIDNPESEWRNLNGIFYYECVQYCKKISLNLPVLCPISISESVINVEKSRKATVDFYSQLPDLNGYFLRIDAVDHNTSTSIIKYISKFIVELERHSPVILADAGTSVFGYLAQGLSGCITSFAESKREYDASHFQSVKKPGGGYKEKFFVPTLFQFVKVDGDLTSLIKEVGTDILCTCSVCKNAKKSSTDLGAQDIGTFISSWSKIDRGNHFLACISEWRKKMSTLSESERLSEYKKLLDKGTAIYDRYAGTNIIFKEIIKKNDCVVWEAAFLGNS